MSLMTFHPVPARPTAAAGVERAGALDADWLRQAHRRLSQTLPPDSPYHAAGRESFFAAAAELLRGARQTSPEDSAMQAWLRQSSHS
ncbi:MAG: hypothetical protein ACT4QA_03715 [Panacagrimonas sp.]